MLACALAVSVLSTCVIVMSSVVILLMVSVTCIMLPCVRPTCAMSMIPMLVPSSHFGFVAGRLGQLKA